MKNDKKKILILGASILQVPGIEKAKEMGLEVYVADMNPNAVGFDIADVNKLVISTVDIPEILEASKENEIDAIMTLASDLPMRTVATVSREMGLVGITEDTALKATNKAVMRQCLKENGVPVPEFFKVSSVEEYKEAIKQFKSAFVVKPADSSGSRGIYLIEDADDTQLLEEAYAYSVQFSRCGDVVVEEFMKGSEVSVETLSLNGEVTVLQITDKLTTGAPHFVEMGHSQPSRHSVEIREEIARVAKAAVKAVGIENGPSHTEIMVTEDGPKIVEIGARMGGDCITTHLVPFSTGIDMVKDTILIALGEAPDLEPKFNKGSAIRYFNVGQGVIKSIEGVEEAEKIEGIKQISFVKAVGETVAEINSSNARAGFVIAQGETAEEAVKICEKALEKITITVE